MFSSEKIDTYNDVKQYLDVSSKQKVMLLLDEIDKKPELVNAVYELAISNEHPFAWRASWAMVHLASKSPGLLKPFVARMVGDIKYLKTDRQIASFLQILTKLDFSEDEAGHLFDFAVKILHDTTKQMYFKLYALQFLVKFVKKVPELAPELLLTIEDEDMVSNNKYIRRQIKGIRGKLKV